MIVIKSAWCWTDAGNTFYGCKWNLMAKKKQKKILFLTETGCENDLNELANLDA